MASLYTFRHLKKVSKFVFHLFKETLMILCDLSLIVSTECWKSDFLYLWKIRSQSQMIHVIISAEVVTPTWHIFHRKLLVCATVPVRWCWRGDGRKKVFVFLKHTYIGVIVSLALYCFHKSRPSSAVHETKIVKNRIYRYNKF